MPGGRLALKVVNGEPILASFRRSDREERDGVVVTLSRSLTLEPPRMVERVSVSGSRGKGRQRRQRLYRVDDLSAAAKIRRRYAIVGLFADACGAVFEPAISPSMWLIGQRPPWRDHEPTGLCDHVRCGPGPIRRVRRIETRARYRWKSAFRLSWAFSYCPP